MICPSCKCKCKCKCSRNCTRPSFKGVYYCMDASAGQEKERKEKMEPGTQKGAGITRTVLPSWFASFYKLFSPSPSFGCGCYGSFRPYLSPKSLLSTGRVGSKRAAEFLAAPGPWVAWPASVVWCGGSIRVNRHRVWAAGAIVDNQGWQREREGVALVYAIAGQSSWLSADTSCF